MKSWNKRYFTGLVLFDLLLPIIVIYSSTVTLYVIYPLIIMSMLGVLIFILNQNTPLKESWVKPAWFPIYDYITDALFLYACYYVGDLTLLFMYAFTIPFKFMIKRESYNV